MVAGGHCCLLMSSSLSLKRCRVLSRYRCCGIFCSAVTNGDCRWRVYLLSCQSLLLTMSSSTLSLKLPLPVEVLLFSFLTAVATACSCTIV